MPTLKGHFKPKNPKKYIGRLKDIVYRSSWEKLWMNYCDTNESVKKWSSEEIAIPYYNPIKKRRARYLPDFYMEYINKEGKLVKALVEIKPSKETKPPSYKRRTKNTLLAEAMYSQNQAKWKAAEEWCNKYRWEWKIITEKELGL